MGGRGTLLSACVLWMHFVSVAALSDPQVCYLLDGILFFYGIILTVLYCRIKMSRVSEQRAAKNQKTPTEEGVYTGLTPRVPETYETIGVNKN